MTAIVGSLLVAVFVLGALSGALGMLVWIGWQWRKAK